MSAGATRPWLLLASAAGASASAIWFLPSSVHIVGSGSAPLVRVALVPPLSRLLPALLAVLAGIAALLAVRPSRPRELHAWRLSPLSLLWLWLIPFLPWLPDRLPVLLVLAGPVRWAILAISLVATAMRFVATRGSTSWRPTRRAVFLASFAVYAALGLRSAADVGFGGDEPHYLVITHSLLVDHDLDIGNNHAQRDYRDFFPGELKPDFLARGRHEEIYSIHAPGLPALLVPAYALAGAPGAVVEMALLAALTAVAVFDLTGASLLSTFLITLTVPFMPHAWLIYPEIPAALIVARAALWIRQPEPALARLALRGVALGLLPWLHTKFVVLLAPLALFNAWRLRPRPRALAAFLLPIAAVDAGWLYTFYRLYGVFDPQAPYGQYARLYVRVANIPRSVIGLLFDQKFGLLVYCPAYALAIVGLWWMFRDRKERAFIAALAVTAAAFVASTARLYMWWGGSSAPARFLVPILPLAAVLIPIAVERLSGPLGRAFVIVTAAASFLVAATCVLSPQEALLFSSPHGRSGFLQALQGPAPLDVLWPTFTEQDWLTPLATLVPWCVAAALGTGVTVWLVRRDRLHSAILSGVVAAAIAALIAGPMTRIPQAEEAGIEALGKASLMRALDPARLRAVGFPGPHRLTVDEALAGSRLTRVSLSDGGAPNFRVPFDLPAGRYEARISFATDAPRRGTALVTLGDGVLASGQPIPRSGDAVVPITLDVSALAWVSITDPQVARAVKRIDFVPVALGPANERQRPPAISIEPAGSFPEPLSSQQTVAPSERLSSAEASAYIAYIDKNTYPEGGVYWTKAARSSSILLVPRSGARLRLILHVGRNAGRVSVDIGASHDELDLKEGETREIEQSLDPAVPVVPITVRAFRSFRPADIDPKSDDLRTLGCQVRPLVSPRPVLSLRPPGNVTQPGPQPWVAKLPTR